MNHPAENDLALLSGASSGGSSSAPAGGDIGRLRGFFLNRHVRACPECRRTMAEFQDLREQVAEFEPPEPDWNALAAEMRANIRLGLEAGACVGGRSLPWRWNPRLAVALACLVVLVVSGFFLNKPRPHPLPAVEAATPMVRSTGSGIELRKGGNSMIFLNRPGVTADQTVSAQGEIRARYIDGETGAVTIDNVYLEQ